MDSLLGTVMEAQTALMAVMSSTVLAAAEGDAIREQQFKKVDTIGEQKHWNVSMLD